MVTNVAQQKHNNNNYYISAFSYKNIDKDYHIKKKKNFYFYLMCGFPGTCISNNLLITCESLSLNKHLEHYLGQ